MGGVWVAYLQFIGGNFLPIPSGGLRIGVGGFPAVRSKVSQLVSAALLSGCSYLSVVRASIALGLEGGW